MGVTRECISHILELKEILLSFQTGFNLVNAAIVCAILESISGLEPSSVITEPKYLKSVHLVNQYWTVPRQTEDDHHILCKEEEDALQSLRKGKPAGVDNIQAEHCMVQAGGEDVITTLMTILNKIWQTGEWPTIWTQFLVITLPNIGNLQQCQNYQTISLINHPSKVMLKIILNRLKPQAEKIIAEEQAGFRTGRSTTQQIFNLGILCKKCLQHQQDLYHVFINFRKALNRVWYAALWATTKKYNISTKLIHVIKNLHEKTTSAVLFNSSTGDWFRTTVEVRQGCLLSPTLFNIFLERIMTDA